MGTPEDRHDVESRLMQVEDAVQRFEFTHRVKTDAQSNGMGILYASQQRLEHMVMGFRAETAAEFGAVHAELAAVKAEQVRQGGLLEEILRRLSEPGGA